MSDFSAEVRPSRLSRQWLGIVRSPDLYQSAGHPDEETARRWCVETIERGRRARAAELQRQRERPDG